jgi:tetratricopeptide (TPR) repeat protein
VGFRARLVAALDDWLFLLPRSEVQKARWLTAVLAAADPNRWRQRLRVARRQGNRQELEQLAVRPGLAGQPPQALLALGQGLHDSGARQKAQALLRRAQQRDPDDFWLNYELAQQLRRQNNHPADAVRYFAICAALRPRSPLPHITFGVALEQAGDHHAAIAAWRHALTLKPQTTIAQRSRGYALVDNGDTPSGLVALRRALRPGHSWLLQTIGAALQQQGDLGGAVEAFFHAGAHDPGSATAHWKLGDALRSQGRLQEARTAYRRALAVSGRRGDWRQTATQKLRETERLIELDGNPQ